MVEEAADGTLFLDEIGDLSVASQVKLLRFLQEGEYLPLGADRPRRVKARVIAATHHDLAAKERTGAFRRDLYYRLRTHHVHVPPLRARIGDLPLLLDHFLDRGGPRARQEAADRPPAAPRSCSPPTTSRGTSASCKSMVYDAVSVHKERMLSMDSFAEAIGRRPADAPAPAGDEERSPFAGLAHLPTFGEALELLAAEAMSRAGGNQTLAARLLGITQPALSKRLKRWRR